MLQELSPDQFERARPLFHDFAYSLSVRAAIDGNNVGRVFVDDVGQPRTATVDHGWTNGEYTSQQEEFGILHDTAEWDALLARMEDG
jgi:hypothetical protein